MQHGKHIYKHKLKETNTENTSVRLSQESIQPCVKNGSKIMTYGPSRESRLETDT